MKRAFDICLSLVLLACLFPLMLVGAVLIRLTSDGPALFVQERVGRNERSFRCLKFRTMALGAPVGATHTVSTDWVTPIGRLMRRSKFDELPQLLNVFFGQMSLVGPRPCLPVQAELRDERRKRNVFSVRPGITGLAQVSGIDMSEPARLAEVDAQYVATRTFWTDLVILWRTAFGGNRPASRTTGQSF